jgi:hypothetical protein
VNKAKHLHASDKQTFACELTECPLCGGEIERCRTLTGRKFVQTLKQVLKISYRAGRCSNQSWPGHRMKWRSSAWQQLAPLHCSYGFDVIARIGWWRQREHKTFGEIQQGLAARVQVSEAEVRHLYDSRYLPLTACLEREQWEELGRLSAESGLILSLDGLAPEGGEPQLWVVRELRSAVTRRSGWMSEQSEAAFKAFLQPLAEALEEREWRLAGLISDKQKGLLPAVEKVFPGVPPGYCQSHYLRNLAEPVAKADEAMKRTLRQRVREEVGELLRREENETGASLTVTGWVPSPLEVESSLQRRWPGERATVECGGVGLF